MSNEDRSHQLDRVAGLLFGLLSTWMLTLEPLRVTPESSWRSAPLLMELAAVYVLFISSWRTHGYLYSMISCTILILTIKSLNDNNTYLEWHVSQTIFIGILGIHLMVWPTLNTGNCQRPYLLLGGLGLTFFSTLLWITSAFMGADLPPPEDHILVSNQRIVLCSFTMLLLGGMLTFRRSRASAVWCAISFLAPVAGFGLVRLWQPISVEHVLLGGAWHRLGPDLLTWAARPNVVANCQAWCWTMPWIVFALMFLGMLRAGGRGSRQRREGKSPLAWLILSAALLLLPALLPASEAARPIGLVWLSIALSVFAIADLLLLLFEQLVLPTPEPGPFRVPQA